MEWKLNHPEYKMKNDIINKIEEILPGFSYLVDFEWVTGQEDYGVGDLIFGSDYGVYVIIETKWLNIMNPEQRARIARNQARNNINYQAIIFKQFAEEKFKNDAIKVIGASYTNDDIIQFVDSQDREIAAIIKKRHKSQKCRHIYLN